MRILIFLDTFRISDSTQKGSVVRHTLRMFAASFSAGNVSIGKDFRILAAHGYRSMSRVYPKLKPRILHPLANESSILSGNLLRQANQRREFLDRFDDSGTYTACLAWAKERFDYQVILCLSGGEMVRKFAVAEGIPCIVLRQGYPSPYLYDCVIFDLDRESPPCLSGDSLPFAALQRLLPVNLYEIGFSPLAASRHAESIYRSTGKNALIVLDAESGCHIRTDAVFNVIMPALLRSGYACHLLPTDSRKGRSIRRHQYRAARRYRKTSENIVWLTGIRSDMERLKLLAKMNVVVSRNSCSGYDAILMGKPVLMLDDVAWAGVDNPFLLQDLQREGFCEKHLERCRAHSLRMANLLLRRILVSKGLAFEKKYFMERVKRLYIQGIAAAGWECDSTAEGSTEWMAEDIDRIRRRLPEPYLLGRSGALRIFGRRNAITGHSKLDRMRRKARKLARDPVKFLQDSQYSGLKAVGALLDKF